MTIRVSIKHEDLSSDLGLRITDYNGTRELWAGQSGDFHIYSGQTINIEEIAPANVEVVAEVSQPPETPAGDTDPTGSTGVVGEGGGQGDVIAPATDAGTVGDGAATPPEDIPATVTEEVAAAEVPAGE